MAICYCPKPTYFRFRFWSISIGPNNSCDPRCFILARCYTLCQPTALGLHSSSFVSRVVRLYRWEGPTQIITQALNLRTGIYGPASILRTCVIITQSNLARLWTSGCGMDFTGTSSNPQSKNQLLKIGPDSV